MANEIQTVYSSGYALYARVRKSSGVVWNTVTSVFENWTAENVGNYDIPQIDKGGDYYVGSFPSCKTGSYIVEVLKQVGGTPSVDDTIIGGGIMEWTGAEETTGVTSDETLFTDSFLTRVIAATRLYIDEPIINAKYTDTRLILENEKAYAMVLGEINRNTRTPIVGKINVVLQEGTNRFYLPTILGMVYAVYEADSLGQKLFYDSRGPYNPYGRLIWMEGSTLCIQSTGIIPLGKTLTVEFLPSGTARLHNGTCEVNSDGTTITLATTPNAGALDTNENAYIGSILRVLKVTGTEAIGNYLQERVITEYNRTTRVATVDVALNPLPVAGDDGYIAYEIAPAIWKGMDEVLACYTAYVIAGIEGNIKRATTLISIYREMMRHLRLMAYYSNLQEASSIPADDYRNRRYRRI